MSFDDKFKEECGVFGIYNAESAATYVVLGLHALQHRGQEAVGIVSYDGKQFHAHRAIGEVDRTFGGDGAIVKSLLGQSAIGHNRYATTGDSMLRNVQPLFADLSEGGVALAHNGNLTNAYALRKKLVQEGRIFQSTSDTEVILHLLAANEGESVTDRLMGALRDVEGAYSLIALTRTKMIGVRDPFGFRPLVIGQLNEAYILASETCALDIMGAEFVREVEPGEMVVIDPDGLKSLSPFRIGKPDEKQYKQHFCIFELIYFARPDSVMQGQSVYHVRTRIGEELAAEHPVEADVVVPIPDSGVPSAIGFAEAANLPFQYGIIRNHYVGRTFIEPGAEIRNLGVKLKHNANRHVVNGKRVVLVDDSVVRGTTSRKIVEMVRAAGATEVHLRIASPPTSHSCFFGVDTPTREELMAYQHDIDQMSELIGVDSLGFISLDGLYRAAGKAQGRSDHSHQRGFCDACFSGDYPIQLHDHQQEQRGENQRQLSLLLEQGHYSR